MGGFFVFFYIFLMMFANATDTDNDTSVDTTKHDDNMLNPPLRDDQDNDYFYTLNSTFCDDDDDLLTNPMYCHLPSNIHYSMCEDDHHHDSYIDFSSDDYLFDTWQDDFYNSIHDDFFDSTSSFTDWDWD